MIGISARSENYFILPLIPVQGANNSFGNDLHLHETHALELSKEPHWERIDGFYPSCENVKDAVNSKVF
jgi:hypothetical protein